MTMAGQRKDQASPTPGSPLRRNERFIIGAAIFAALIGGFWLYSTHKSEQATNQLGPISAPETPAVPGGAK
jgi:hypothetical protein